MNKRRRCHSPGYRPALRGLALAVSLLAASPAFAEGPNLLSNPGFDRSTEGWTVTGPGTLSWSSADADGSPHSGSAKVRVTGPAFGVWVTASPCIRLSPGEEYVATGSVLVEDADVADLVGIGILYFSDPSCTTWSSSMSSPDLGIDSPGWHRTGTHIGPFSEIPEEYQSIQIMLFAADTGPRGDFTVYFDDVALRTGVCDPEALCLNDRRFQVSARWKLADGTEGQARGVPYGNESGIFWFFSPENIEMTVKVLNGCSQNQHYWVFATGMTNVAVTLTVRDTVTGELKIYENPQGRRFRLITDTAAFDCP